MCPLIDCKSTLVDKSTIGRQYGTPYMSWNRILERSRAFEASDRSIAVSIGDGGGGETSTRPALDFAEENGINWLIMRLVQMADIQSKSQIPPRSVPPVGKLGASLQKVFQNSRL